MQKLDQLPVRTTFRDLQLIDASSQRESGFETSRRLLVIVSDSDLDAPAAARRILEVAHAFKSPILFLGLCKDSSEEPSLQRQLVTLSAMIRDEHIPFDMKVESGKGLLELVRVQCKQNDVLVCFAGQRDRKNGRLVSTLLQANFSSTIYVVDARLQNEQTHSNWKSELLGWAGSIGILLAFFWLQLNINQNFRNWENTALLIASVPLEVWALWTWNRLLG